MPDYTTIYPFQPVDLLRVIRWGENNERAYCPHCGSKRIIHFKDRKAGKHNNKAAVVGVLKRDGELRARHVHSKAAIANEVYRNVSPDARLITDSSPAYNGVTYDYDHHIVNHSKGEYVRSDVHTNSLESVWGLFKKQVNGTHHWVSKKHLQAYVNEMTWRFNRRDFEEGDRMNSFLEQVHGRLTYKTLTA